MFTQGSKNCKKGIEEGIRKSTFNSVTNKHSGKQSGLEISGQSKDKLAFIEDLPQKR